MGLISNFSHWLYSHQRGIFVHWVSNQYCLSLNSFNSLNQVREVFLSPFDRWANWGSEMSATQLKAILLLNERSKYVFYLGRGGLGVEGQKINFKHELIYMFKLKKYSAVSLKDIRASDYFLSLCHPPPVHMGGLAMSLLSVRVTVFQPGSLLSCCRNEMNGRRELGSKLPAQGWELGGRRLPVVWWGRQAESLLFVK